MHSFTDFEVYLKTKIAEVHNISNDEGNSCCSDPIPILSRRLQMKSRLMKPSFHAIDAMPAHRSLTNDSKVSVYYTPNDSVDQPQLQLSPMHINIIRENLNTFADCIKPSESICKFDYDMHQLESNLEFEIDRRRRRQFGMYSEDDEDETIEINAEHTRMLNNDGAIDNMDNSSTHGYIRLNTLPKRYKYKRAPTGKELYYSLENIFDPMNGATNLYELKLSNKTIDEVSETQVTSSISDNSSSNNMSRSNPINCNSSDDNNHESKSVLILNEISSDESNELQTSTSMPNISKTKSLKCEQNLNLHTDYAVINNEHSQLDRKLPTENANHD